MVRAAAGADFALLSIAQELCDSRYGALLMAGQATGRVLEACKVLVNAHDEISQTQRDELLELLGRARTTFQKRHQYVHGVAVVDAEGTLRSVRTRHLKAGVEGPPVSIDELHSLRVDFDALTLALVEWLATLVTGVPGQVVPQPGTV